MTHLEKYMSIIQNRLVNTLPDDVYGEIHHIIPRSIDPTLAKTPSNLVRLSAQEHFLAHYHLWLYYRDELQAKEWAKTMCYAFHCMKRVITKCEDVETMAKIYSHVKEDFAKIRSEAMKERMKNPENNPMKRPEVKEKIMGDKSPTKRPEVRAKISEAKKGDKNPSKRPEVRAKMSEALSKRVLQCTLDGNFVAEFPSINDATRKTGCHSSSISMCCHGKLKTAGGFIWRFSDEVHADK